MHAMRVAGAEFAAEISTIGERETTDIHDTETSNIKYLPRLLPGEGHGLNRSDNGEGAAFFSQARAC